MDNKQSEKTRNTANFSVSYPYTTRREETNVESEKAVMQTRNNVVADGLRSKVNGMPLATPSTLGNESRNLLQNSGCDTNTRALKNELSTKNLQKTRRQTEFNNLGVASDLHHDTSSDALPTEVILR